MKKDPQVCAVWPSVGVWVRSAGHLSCSTGADADSSQKLLWVKRGPATRIVEIMSAMKLGLAYKWGRNATKRIRCRNRRAGRYDRTDCWGTVGASNVGCRIPRRERVHAAQLCVVVRSIGELLRTKPTKWHQLVRYQVCNDEHRSERSVKMACSSFAYLDDHGSTIAWFEPHCWDRDAPHHSALLCAGS